MLLPFFSVLHGEGKTLLKISFGPRNSYCFQWSLRSFLAGEAEVLVHMRLAQVSALLSPLPSCSVWKRRWVCVFVLTSLFISFILSLTGAFFLPFSLMTHSLFPCLLDRNWITQNRNYMTLLRIQQSNSDAWFLHGRSRRMGGRAGFHGCPKCPFVIWNVKFLSLLPQSLPAQQRSILGQLFFETLLTVPLRVGDIFLGCLSWPIYGNCFKNMPGLTLRSLSEMWEQKFKRVWKLTESKQALCIFILFYYYFFSIWN